MYKFIVKQWISQKTQTNPQSLSDDAEGRALQGDNEDEFRTRNFQSPDT